MRDPDQPIVPGHRWQRGILEALSDRSRRPVRYANQLPAQIETLIVQLKAEKPHWGPRKIRELLVRRLDGDVRVPAKSTIHAILDRHGLVRRGGGDVVRCALEAVPSGGRALSGLRWRVERRTANRVGAFHLR